MKLVGRLFVLFLLVALGGELRAEALVQDNWIVNVSGRIPNDMLTARGVPVNPIFLPFAFKAEVLPRKMNLLPEEEKSGAVGIRLESGDVTMEWFGRLVRRDSIRSRVQVYAAVTDPSTVRYLLNRLESQKAREEQMEREAVSQKKIPTLFQSEESRVPTLPAEMKGVALKKLSMWQSNSVANIQFTQNYISDNWHQGGESNVSLLSAYNWKTVYRDEKNIQFENELDWRAGFFSAPSDTLRTFRVNDDQLRLTTKFGYKAFQKWYYTGSFEFKTKLFNSYRPNSSDLLSTFMTPAEGYFSLGMDFKTSFDKPKISNLSLFFAPFTYSFKYAAQSSKVDVKRYGIEEGKSSLHAIGSMFRGSMKYEITNNIVWDTRVYYFTNYSNVEVEWENSFHFILNRYFSSRLFCIVRYDDRVTLKSPEDSYFQFKEFLSLGFTYKW